MATTNPPATSTASLKVALIGNPNTGKSTLFNTLAGVHARVGNYPGCTVEKKVGRVRWEGRSIDLIDLPGAYSLSPRSLDEMVSVDVLLGKQKDVGAIDVVVCIVDASNLERNLYLASQVLDMGLRTVLVLNMWDVARDQGQTIDVAQLEQRLGVPILTTVGHRREGLAELRTAILETAEKPPADPKRLFPDEFYRERDALGEKIQEKYGEQLETFLLQRLILDAGGYLEKHPSHEHIGDVTGWVREARERLAEAGHRIPALEARVRYGWIRETLQDVAERPAERPASRSDMLDRILTHRVGGLAIFALLMFVVFQAIYKWAGPLMDGVLAFQDLIASFVRDLIPPGALQSLLADGVVAGVGSVLVFLPQIILLFLFIAVLEDCGYMARAAFLMDKLMSRIGLSGKSFVPLMSSFACAIPGVMATRVIEDRRDRMVTILVAPLMSCSARLPVYLLLIAAFIPSLSYVGGLVSLKGLVLFAMYALGALVAIPVALILKATFFRGETPPFVMELPAYKLPSVRIVAARVYDRAKAFTVRAGTLIFATTIVVWAAGYFPGNHEPVHQLNERIESLEEQLPPALLEADEEEPTVTEEDLTAEQQQAYQQLQTLVVERNRRSSELLEGSVLGTVGHAIEPVVRPLGWDWRIGVGVVASFPAREVIIATLGTIYSLGGEVSEEDPRLSDALQRSEWPDGRKVYNIPVALSIMVFFALCAQCGSTLMVIRREANSWGWAAFTFFYMTALAYLGALLTYQVGSLFL